MVENNLTILVVEDEQLLLDAIKRKLAAREITVIGHTSGKTALEYLQETTTVPDAIWLDYTLKDVDGFGFMHELKENKKLAHIPVVVVSNSASDEKVKNMLALGVENYLLKANYRIEDILDIIVKFIHEQKQPAGGQHE